MKVFFLFLTLPLFWSCQSTHIEGFTPSQRNYFKAVIEHACFSEGKGSFLANVSSSSLPSINWEGKWTNQFSKLHTQLVDPVGRVLDDNPFAQIEAKFGARGLRSVMCGQTAFLKFIKLEGHKINIKTKIRSVYQNNDETLLETTSEFYYGLFAQKSPIKMMWKGRVKDGVVTPLSIHFGSVDEIVSIDFLDYE